MLTYLYDYLFTITQETAAVVVTFITTVSIYFEFTFVFLPLRILSDMYWPLKLSYNHIHTTA